MNQFPQVEVIHVSRSENDKTNALAKLVASLILLDEREIQITIGECHLLASTLDRFDKTKEINMVSIFKIEELEWRHPLI